MVVTRGGKRFRDISLPSEATTFAQGVVRLIRTTEHRGVVAVRDRRLATARYANVLVETFLNMSHSDQRRLVKLLEAAASTQ